ncbi:MAG: hypothetical protein GF308_16445 [Candidatus Heimdallarchaeota archaeon]|nr:hypothetical protein [Candidatus Heimdallarchaeota archaeon]
MTKARIFLARTVKAKEGGHSIRMKASVSYSTTLNGSFLAQALTASR